MSQRLISLNPDLKRLRDDEYNVEEISGYLVMRDIPYLNAQRQVLKGVLVSRLKLAGDRTVNPIADGEHTVLFAGEWPCNFDGSQISHRNGDSNERITDDIVTQHSFSSKPTEGYQDYYHKMTTYVGIISNPAKAMDPNVTAQTHPVVLPDEVDDSPFLYIDTASSRADIVAVSAKLRLPKVAIVGLGGTGSYVLDLVAKTHVKEIHLYDEDSFLQHNAFRAPGAASVEDFQKDSGGAPKKVDYFTEKYSKMRRGIVSHAYSLDDSNVSELNGMDFVFLCIDGGERKRHIVEKLEELDIPFIDTGIGINVTDDSLHGTIRSTLNTPQKRDHFRTRVGFSNDDNDEYARNIQIADLNALNAAHAVIRWKKLFGFYKDYTSEHTSLYDVDGNFIHNEDMP